MPLLNDFDRIRSNFKRAKVLVIEDNLDHWTLIKAAMQECLPEVIPVHVEKPEKALELLNEWVTQEWELPKLIFQDLYLPDREDSWHLLQQIKAMALPCSRIPVVLLSSSNHHPDIEEAYQRGVTSYMVKPVEFSGWLAYFRELRAYWWETVTLPPMQFNL